ncbi:MAG: PadR family transcriptional regulator [Planctomycetota bacterium]
MKTWITQLRKGLLEFLVLNVLSAGESYGYRIVRRLKSLEEMAISESTIYPILVRLRKDGYLKVRVAPSSSGPPRRYFRLTSIGRRRVKELNGYWDSLCEAIEACRSSGG